MRSPMESTLTRDLSDDKCVTSLSTHSAVWKSTRQGNINLTPQPHNLSKERVMKKWRKFERWKRSKNKGRESCTKASHSTMWPSSSTWTLFSRLMVSKFSISMTGLFSHSRDTTRYMIHTSSVFNSGSPSVKQTQTETAWGGHLFNTNIRLRNVGAVWEGEQMVSTTKWWPT